jgi:hypothetical protein
LEDTNDDFKECAHEILAEAVRLEMNQVKKICEKHFENEEAASL